jgi:hypothetical protein
MEARRDPCRRLIKRSGLNDGLGPAQNAPAAVSVHPGIAQGARDLPEEARQTLEVGLHGV